MNTPLLQQSTQRVPAEAPGAVKSWLRQRHEMVQLYARCLIPPAHYRLYRFHERDKDQRYMLNFLSSAAQKSKLQPIVNDPRWKVVLDNKWLFHLHYQQFGLPLPQVYGIYERGTGMTITGRPLTTPEQLFAFLQERRIAALVAKPVGGIMGKQVLVLREIHYAAGTLQAITNTGQTMTFAEVMAVLDQAPDVRYYMSGYKLDLTGYLLQEKIQQHPFLNALAPTTTNTIRVVTLLDDQNNVDILFTIVRLGRRGNMADNWDRGGLSVAIDPVSGRLGAGVLKPAYGGQWMELHPDTGARFTGQIMPYWRDILALCTRAAQVTPKVRSVGWDVALTPAGPVLIEGNPDWDLAMVQVHTQGLLQPAVRAKLARFGVCFPQGHLPPIDLRGWWVRLREQYREYAFTSPGRSPLKKLLGFYLNEIRTIVLK